MKILVIDVDNPWGANPGGQAAYSKQYIWPLAEMHLIGFLTLGRIQNNDIKNISFMSINKKMSQKLSILNFAREVRKYVKRNGSNYDLILEQFTTPIGPLGLPGLTSTHVIGIAAFSFWHEMGRKYFLPIAMIAKRRLSKYSTIVVLHKNLKNDLLYLNPRMNVLVTPLSAPNLQSHDIPHSTNRAVFIGRPDVHQKGIDLLFKALGEVNIPNLEVLCIGFDESEHFWGELRSKTDLSCNLSAVGYLTSEQLSEVLTGTRCILAPSRYEGPSYVPLLGAARGIPTIAFDLPCFSEWSDFMLLSKPYSISEFAKNIERIFNDEKLFHEKVIGANNSSALLVNSGVEDFRLLINNILGIESA